MATQQTTARLAITRERSRFVVRGLVQGVGFRPFVYALARELALAGWVRNNADGVVAEVEGRAADVTAFARRLRADPPGLARIDAVEQVDAALLGGTEFRIEESSGGVGRTLVSPDVATCPDCLTELSDPADRRYRHPFISCTNCGPRFTVVMTLPYDRPATTMAGLPLCARCRAEYGDPANRRFHAQTIACPDCGPTVVLDRPGHMRVMGDQAVASARALLTHGLVVAVKGLGGYHLACDATNEAAVARLRERKNRGDKPFAVMAADLGAAERIAVVGEFERALLTDARRPVVILVQQRGTSLAASVAPDHPDVGVLLPYTPLHHLLFGLPGDVPGPDVLVMTSGNLAGEPIITDDAEAATRLGTLADAFLVNDRPIHVPCDDSVIRVASGRVLPIRRSRGFAPLPIDLPFRVRPALAVGGDLKNTFAVADGRLAWLSAHVGDMADLSTLRAFERGVEHLSALTGVEPEVVVADAHPAYRSSLWAKQHAGDRPLRLVQHHHAHVAAALAENGWPGGSVIGFAFDGTGYGSDGAVWGGEVLLADYAGFARIGHLRYVPLPGGDAGVRNPCRMALSHLTAAGVEWDERAPSVGACTSDERAVLRRQLHTGVGCVPTSSMGRLFDAVSSLAGVCHRVDYEAEAAMRFEELAGDVSADGGYAFGLAPDGVADPAPVIREVVADVLAGVPAPTVAARFHAAVTDLVVAWAQQVRARTGVDVAALSGGVFLNALLTARCAERLSAAGFQVLTHSRVPPSDAGLALGQLAVGARSD